MKSKRVLITSFGFVLVIIFAITVFFYANFKTVVVTGNSMEPTFKSGRRLLSSRAYWLVGDIQPRDVIVIRGETPGEYMIKRVYKLGGQVVDWANVPENWSISSGEYVVPKDHVYVLGDNRDYSEDSRRYGAVKVDRILGKIVSY